MAASEILATLVWVLVFARLGWMVAHPPGRAARRTQ